MPYVIFGIALVVAVVATWFIAVAYRKNIAEAKVGKAEDKAREIIDEALKSAEAKKRETLLEAKEEALKTKNEIDKEVKDRRNELQRMEKRVLSREENLDRKSEAIEKRKLLLISVKMSLMPSKVRLLIWKQKELRNWRESPDLPLNKQRNTY